MKEFNPDMLPKKEIKKPEASSNVKKLSPAVVEKEPPHGISLEEYEDLKKHNQFLQEQLDKERAAREALKDGKEYAEPIRHIDGTVKWDDYTPDVELNIELKDPTLEPCYVAKEQLRYQESRRKGWIPVTYEQTNMEPPPGIRRDSLVENVDLILCAQPKWRAEQIRAAERGDKERDLQIKKDNLATFAEQNNIKFRTFEQSLEKV